MSLISSLGLDAVTADINDIPVGKYDGIVSKSEFALVEPKKQVSHVITYKVTEGDFKGAEKQVWYNLYGEIVDAEGNFPKSPEDIKGGKPLMTDNNKRWYKKALMDLTGCSEEEAGKVTPEMLVGKEVTFGVAEKNGYKNVNFVERRNVAPEGVTGEASGFATNF